MADEHGRHDSSSIKTIQIFPYVLGVSHPSFFMLSFLITSEKYKLENILFSCLCYFQCLRTNVLFQTDTSSNMTKLRVENSNRNDSGKYTITAKNEFGKDSADMEVTVVNKPGQPKGPLNYNTVTQDTISLSKWWWRQWHHRLDYQ